MIGVLGVILIYTILIGKVEEKTYEYGMLRALGLPQLSLIEVILIQALYFAIPGVIIAMLISWGVGIGVGKNLI
jgi:ABC-type antimicrobial peptide transport system permease subunit